MTTPALPCTPRERLLHALTFEAIALVICAPVLAWWMGTPLAHMSVLTLAISLIAMGWNMMFNAGFDRLQQRWGFHRGLVVRVLHAAVFELGLIIAVVPLAAWWLGIGLWEALLLDIGVLLFFLPYAVVFNWAWDLLRPPCAAADAETAEATCGARS